jgi:hypothetical protein
VCLATAIVASACGAGSVRWSDPVASAAVPGETELVVDSAGQVRWRAIPPQPALSEPAGVCAPSLRARAGRSAFYGAWWTVRPDSSALLYVGRSIDRGATWARVTVVDSADASRVGCRRPAPSIAVVGDDVFVAYAMKAVDGTGVFFAHSMDAGAMFHAPVPIVYGDRLVAPAVASDGQRVAVAYEEPNGPARSVSVALSRTQGHIFETRVAASGQNQQIILPHVAIAGRTVAVGWTTQPAGDRGGLSVTRIGRMAD